MLLRSIYFTIFWAVVCVGASSAKADLLHVNEEFLYDQNSNLRWTIIVSDTKLTYSQLFDWLDELNRQERPSGYSSWMLPYTTDGTWWKNNGDNNDKYGVTESYLGYLYYILLGLESRQGLDPNQKSIDVGKPSEWDEKTTCLESLEPKLYWLGTDSAKTLHGMDAAWVFDFAWGSQYLDTENSTSNYGIALRYFSPVPEPSSLLLLFVGMLALCRLRPR
nr:PEP-CTERM sorting domain-containing protein [uncultured Desulfobulbus sp.]